MKKYLITIGFLAFLNTQHTVAQLNLPIRSIGGKEYYYRQIKNKETIYGISKELGVSKEDIIKYNPSVANGLKKDQTIYFPVSIFQSNTESSSSLLASDHKHLVKKGETVYGISNMYGIAVEDLMQANPNIRNGLKEGMTVSIPLDKRLSDAEGTPYTVKSGDTLYRLSVNFNVELQDLLELNPGITPDNFKSGMTILIPIPKKKASTGDRFLLEEAERGETMASIASEHNIPETQIKEANPHIDKLKRGTIVSIPKLKNDTTICDSVEVRRIYDSMRAENDGTPFIISVLLPLQSNSTTPGKQQLLYRDFYRGILVALDTITRKNQNVNLAVFDTDEHNIDMILQNENIRKSDLIFAPGEDYLLNKIATFGKSNNIDVVSAFSVNNNLCYENDHFYQINTPSTQMYTAVSNYLLEKFEDYELVLLEDPSSGSESPLVEYLSKSGKPFQQINLESSDTFVCKGKTLFLPVSGNRSVLSKVKNFYNLVQSEHLNENILVGYPEWTILHDFEPFFKQANTYLFSRYLLNMDDVLDSKYTYWFGETPINSYPQMYSLGYDLTNYFVDCHFSGAQEPMPQISGTQINLALKRCSNWSGFMNMSVYIYHFSESGVEKFTIQ